MTASRPDATTKELEKAKQKFTFKYRRAARNVCQILPQSATTSRESAILVFWTARETSCVDITRIIGMSTIMIHLKLSAESHT